MRLKFSGISFWTNNLLEIIIDIMDDFQIEHEDNKTHIHYLGEIKTIERDTLKCEVCS